MTQSSQRRKMPVADAFGLEGRCEDIGIELGIVAGPRDRAHVGHEPDLVRLQHREECFERMIRMADGEDRPCAAVRGLVHGPGVVACSAGDHTGAGLLMRDRNSSLVAGFVRKTPSTDEVTNMEFCFSTPRIIMQRWRASIITPTPSALIESLTA